MPAASPKRARQAADRIVADIASRGWPAGEVLGSESELVERYKVSRAVFREAVRIVEHQQVAAMRRGPGGGLVIAEPSIETVTTAVFVYLHRIKPHLDEVVEARLVVEDLVVALATERLTEDGIAALRTLARREAAEPVHDRELHARLASSSENPALELFVGILAKVLRLYVPDVRMVPVANRRAASHAHDAITAAILAGDAGRARHCMRVHLEHEADWIRTRRARRTWPAPLPAPARDAKRGEAISNEVFRAIVADGWPVGSFIGSEADLMTRYGVSRAVLREAIRLLELQQVASMRRGPRGGLFVVEPSIAAVTDAAAVYLEWRRTSLSQIAEARAGLELAVLDLAIKRLDDSGVTALHQALEAERATPANVFDVVGHDLHDEVATRCGNRILELFVRVLVRMTRLHQYSSPNRTMARPVIDEVQRSHSGIVDAVAARDAELARHRMLRHLEALVAFLH